MHVPGRGHDYSEHDRYEGGDQRRSTPRAIDERGRTRTTTATPTIQSDQARTS